MNRAEQASTTDDVPRKAGSIRHLAGPYEAFERNYPVTVNDAAALFPGRGRSYTALRRKLKEAGAKPVAHLRSNGGQMALYWPADLAIVMWGESVARRIVNCSQSTILTPCERRAEDGA